MFERNVAARTIPVGRIRQILLCLIITCVLAPPAPAQRSAARRSVRSNTAAKVDGEWASFRGPSGQGESAQSGLPLTWSQQKNIAWKTELPGPGASSPIVSGDRIYVTCYSGFFVPGQPEGDQKNLRRHLICVDRASGKIQWDQAVPALLPEERSIRDHGFAASTPATDETGVYCFFGKTGVYKFDHSGKVLWKSDVGSRTHGWGSAASPVLYRDLVFINASVESESLVALNKNTGREVWRAGNIKEAWNTPVVVTNVGGQPELIIATHGTIRSYNPDKGDLLWTCATDIQWYMVPGIVAKDGVVYSLGGRSGTAGLAVRTGGREDVTGTHRL
ncbi:MAG: PQQ-binding-like beta-propeller repeat protein, partial [Planctomycetaceae bacterium]|nr:PQQ-binding-like beta-propeller repeat protein [Planctomycetaceae bacterium]